MKVKELKNGLITSPLGFKTNALYCGIRSKKLDLCLIYSIVKAYAAGVFTSNKVKAAPVVVDMQNLRNGYAQAIVINSGNANCCTGNKGKQDALKIIGELSRYLQLRKNDVLIASTGVIGKFLPVGKIIKALPELVDGLGFDKAHQTAKAIMTTDTYPKQAAVEVKIKGKRVTIAAVAKGAGMIHPDMATMLCFITTDADIRSPVLKKALKFAVAGSFNCISVDNEMSTNDTVIALANGLAANPLIKDKSKEFKIFTRALEYLCLKLAKMIVSDGEGATKIVRVNIHGAKTKKQAKQAAAALAGSVLVKTMIAGNNPNWGRILARIGASGVSFEPERLKVSLQGKLVYKNAMPALKNNNLLIKLLKKKNICIDVHLGNGSFGHTIWTTDLTKEYVRINMEYN